MNTTIQTLYKDARQTLSLAGIDSPALDARIFIKAVLGITDADLIAGDDRLVSAAEEAALSAMLDRRVAGEPVSRILGRREFWGMDFIVTPDVLDPRPDTETLVQAAVDMMRARPPARILDLGTGSGCILISLLREFPTAQGVAVDISESALNIARQNAERHDVAHRVNFLQGRWFEPVTGLFDLIVSNPPYIPNPDIESLDREVRNHDPILALAGGDDGYDAYRTIIKGIKTHAASGVLCYLEIGINQGENVARLAEESNLCVDRIIPDIAGIPRAVEISCGDK
ncbi:MAG: peptide chain release factor N(5)-glutamine methyltransferase [Alphaproteobacteria bacterium]|nr:peptide chain release factor N(5)-glutamine methyltransferase [Alphaproteobacteria bacterium]